MALPIIAVLARGAAALGRAASQAVAAVGQGAAQAAQSAGGGFARAIQVAMTGAGMPGAAASAGQPAQFATAAAQAVGQPHVFAQAAGPAAQAATGGGGVPPVPPMPAGRSPFTGLPTQLMQTLTANIPTSAGNGPSIAGIARSISTGDRMADAAKDAAIALATLPATVRDFGSSVVEARRGLAEYNGGIAASLTRLEHDRFGRTVELAGATSASTEQLAQAQSRLEERLLPYAAAGANTLIQIVTQIANLTATVLALGESLSPLMRVIVDKQARIAAAAEKDASGQLVKLTAELAAGNVFKRNMPPRDKK